MTAQFPDTCIFEDTTYVLAGINGAPLFEPTPVDLIPASVISACWRGYVCTYALMAGRLQLHTLHIMLGEFVGEQRQRTFVPHQGPPLQGVAPHFTIERAALFNNTYTNLYWDVPFSGGLLLADGFIDELYVHMGFHPAWKYKKVLKIECEGGNIIYTRDVSERIAEIRSERQSRQAKSSKMSQEELRAWIEATFRRDYNL